MLGAVLCMLFISLMYQSMVATYADNCTGVKESYLDFWGTVGLSTNLVDWIKPERRLWFFGSIGQYLQDVVCLENYKIPIWDFWPKKSAKVIFFTYVHIRAFLTSFLKSHFGRVIQNLILIVLALKWHLKHQNMSRNNKDIITFNKKFDKKTHFFFLSEKVLPLLTIFM